ncbi:hypothetical protein V1264_016924 [Littorina saxatilis]|uniref:hexokinase n=1 Tax=Littorina saxatilis TaxID=31220 RepID=A0AAN9GF79_9CAEN
MYLLFFSLPDTTEINMFVVGALLLYVLFGPQPFIVQAAMTQITCEAGTVTAGENAFVTCNFHTNMNADIRGILLEHHPHNGTESAVLACTWGKEEQKHQCTAENGSVINIVINDRLRHTIPTVGRENAGMYVCYLVPGEGTKSHVCDMDVKARAHTLPEPTSTIGTGSSVQGESSVPSFIAPLVIVLMVLLFAAVVIVVIIFIRRRRPRMADGSLTKPMLPKEPQDEQQEKDIRTPQADAPSDPRAPEPMVPNQPRPEHQDRLPALSEKVKDCVSGFKLSDRESERLMDHFSKEVNAGKTSMNIDMSSADIKSLEDKTDAFLVVDLSDDILRVHYVWLRDGMAGRNPKPKPESNPGVDKLQDNQTRLNSKTTSDQAVKRRPDGQSNSNSKARSDKAADKSRDGQTNPQTTSDQAADGQTNSTSETSRGQATQRVPGTRCEKYRIPAGTRHGTGVQLFDFVAQSVKGFVKKLKLSGQNCLVGFVFSFPCKQDQHLTKARLTKWTKQFRCDGVVDEEVGELLRNALQIKKISCRMELTNIVSDDVSTLVWVARDHTDPSCKIALILTNGFYACHEKGRQSTGPENSPGGKQTHMMIQKTDFGAIVENQRLTESFQTDFDKELDRCSIDPGSRIMEKMVSIMYLGEIVRLILVDLVSKDLLFQATLSESSGVFKRDAFNDGHVSLIECYTSKDFAHTRHVLTQLGLTDCTDEDCRIVQYVTRAVSERAGRIAAIGLAALINCINQPDVTVAIPGKSLETYHQRFKLFLETRLKGLVKPGLTFKIVSSCDGIEMGTALIASALSSHWDISKDTTDQNGTTNNFNTKTTKEEKKEKKEQ